MHPATWPELFFPGGTTFKGLTIGPFGVVYPRLDVLRTPELDLRLLNGLGNRPWDGNITGCFVFRHRWWP